MLPCFKPTLVCEFISEELYSQEPVVFRFARFSSWGSPRFGPWVGAAFRPREAALLSPRGEQVWVLRRSEPAHRFNTTLPSIQDSPGDPEGLAQSRSG